ncbi:ATP-binding cassette sub-family B member 10, mitochondrial [Lepeophtheirus salmonis]|uniref:ATP-binding cassette sub-family B member 10, mitochondrial n=1 Tax=Lepeophtheirus salmonis TaxID=72036 RepID=UPI001AE3B1AB|nr:ATP-binding cassette sub-family B member 10, mitochondrial-like [Lepeophtheirus salmonis]
MLSRLLRTGVVTLGRRNISFSRPKGKEWKKLFEFAYPERKAIGGAMGLILISSGVTMSVPYAIGKIIDIIYELGDRNNSDEEKKKASTRSRLNSLCTALLVVFGIGAICNFGRVYLIQLSGQRITARIRSRLFSSITKQETAFFDTNKTGELVNRLSSDSMLVSQALTSQISSGMRSSIMALAGGGMMLFMSPQLALVGLSVVPPVAGWAVWMGKKVKNISHEYQNTLADATHLAQERIANIRTVRAFGKEVQESMAYDEKMSLVLDKGVKEALIQAKFYGMTGLTGNLIILSVMFYGGFLVTQDVITVGNLTSFILYSGYVGIGLNGVSSFYAEIMKALGAATRIWEIMDRTTHMPLDTGLILPMPLNGHITFEKVGFSYPSRPDHSIFDGLNLNIESKQILAIVGSSGSGKSTLTSLLLRLYDPNMGRVCIDGTDIRELNTTWLRNQIGIVMQEPVLFSGTIKDNILYGTEGKIEHEEIVSAAKESNAHDFIMNFPDRYDTLVGERGVLLSGGQKQRVAIARAILKDPQILILDEATSALDAASEHEVKEALNRVMKGRTVVTIAHRLSTIQNADRIAVVHEGKVMEIGSYSELMNISNGYFKNLVQKQTFSV